jgi:hypothetical protein
MRRFHALIVSALLLLAAAPARAQTPVPDVVASDTLSEIRLADGSVLVGRVEAVDADRIIVVTSGGTRVEVRRSQIRSIRAVRVRGTDGMVYREDPAGTRLFFAPTGRSLGAGEGYFGVYELFFPFVSVGVTDRFTVAAGTPIIPEAIGEFFYVAPKVTVVKTERVNLGAGAFVGFADGEAGGIGFAVGTVGDRDNALTGGVGVGFGGGEVSQPILMLGGETRLGRQTKLLTENYLFPSENGVVISGGIRFFGEQLSADAGLAAGSLDGGFACCLPLVNFVYTFGRR